MPAIVFSIIRALVIFLFELVAFFFFYNRPDGRRAVYFSWYAWIIDALAILSGTAIMAATIYALHHPGLFTIDVPGWAFVASFVIGSWQAAIHAVKLIIRSFSRRGIERE